MADKALMPVSRSVGEPMDNNAAGNERGVIMLVNKETLTETIGELTRKLENMTLLKFLSNAEAWINEFQSKATFKRMNKDHWPETMGLYMDQTYVQLV